MYPFTYKEFVLKGDRLENRHAVFGYGNKTILKMVITCMDKLNNTFDVNYLYIMLEHECDIL